MFLCSWFLLRLHAQLLEALKKCCRQIAEEFKAKKNQKMCLFKRSKITSSHVIDLMTNTPDVSIASVLL